MGWILLTIALIALVVVHHGRVSDSKKAAKAAEEAKRGADESAHRFRQQIDALDEELHSLRPFKNVRDAMAATAVLRAEGQRILEDARREAEALGITAGTEAKRIRFEAATEANRILSEAAAEASRLRSESVAESNSLKLDSKTSHAMAQAKIASLILSANTRAEVIIAEAEARAEEVAGDAYRALKEADQLKRVTVAMGNVIDGYGDRYLVPTYSLLDQLGETYGFDEAGRELTASREMSRNLVTSGRAAECDYVETNRRETALRFVLDAFNGKVDTILARAKSDNAGTLEQQIKDAFSLVNHNGAAFRNARISPDYLSSRLKELKWAASVQALREREKEEQRRIREQIREEEKAQREIERALKDAAREEDFLQKALQKVQAQVAKANEEQRAGFEAKLLELQGKLADAEAKNQRALSMAQQTKAGHVYVISNVGSFGEDVLKVGMTRRLEPVDRIRELGDASVPFGFDIHAMIWTDDAPALERELHRRFVRSQINKVNPRKEFFRIPLSAIRESVSTMGLEAVWTISAEATQYRETLAIEKSLQANTAAAQDWLRAQLQVTPEIVSDVAESEPGVGEPVTA